MPSTLTNYGLSVDVPPGWDAKIFKREPVDPGGTTHAVLHAGNFALPADAGDFGNGAYTIMGPGNVFVALVEFHPSSASDALFSRLTRLPLPITASCYDPYAMPVVVPGMSGSQFFLTVAGRAFSLFSVIGNHASRAALAPLVHTLVSSIRISPNGAH
jgi:hypothetical protein